MKLETPSLASQTKQGAPSDFGYKLGELPPYTKLENKLKVYRYIVSSLIPVGMAMWTLHAFSQILYGLVDPPTSV